MQCDLHQPGCAASSARFRPSLTDAVGHNRPQLCPHAHLLMGIAERQWHLLASGKHIGQSPLAVLFLQLQPAARGYMSAMLSTWSSTHIARHCLPDQSKLDEYPNITAHTDALTEQILGLYST